MSSNDKGFNEKRDFIRMTISAPLTAKLSHDQGVIEGVCKDLSGGGMQVESPTEIEVGAELVIEISSNHGHNPTLHARAKVTRCVAHHIRGYVMGLEIIEVLK